MEELPDGTIVYCHCKKPEREGEILMECDYCGGWFHYECVKSYVTIDYHCIDKFCCRDCIVDTLDPNDPARRITTYKRTCGLEGCKQPARLEEMNKYCSDAHEREWAKRTVAKLGKDEQAKFKAMLKQCPPAMAQYAGAEPGMIPGVDVPLEGDINDSPFWRRLNVSWDADEAAEEMRTQIAQCFTEDNGGYKYLYDKTVAQQKSIIAEREEHKYLTQLRLDFLDAAKPYSRNFVAQHKAEHGIDLVAPKSRAKLSMNNPANDICGYDYRMHANDEWYKAWAEEKSAKNDAASPVRLSDDDSKSIFFLGGVEDVDPKTISHTVCIKIKCKTHFDWALIASNHLRTTMETINTEISRAEEMIEKLEQTMKKKNASAQLAANFRKFCLKKLRREQLQLFREMVAERRFDKGDVQEEFDMLYRQVLRKIPGEIAEPDGVYEKVEDVKMEGTSVNTEQVVKAEPSPA